MTEIKIYTSIGVVIGLILSYVLLNSGKWITTFLIWYLVFGNPQF